MEGYIAEFFGNPLLVTGILLLLAFVLYFGMEHTHMKHKSHRVRLQVMSGWGILIITLAAVGLFTPAYSFVAKAYGGVPVELSVEGKSLHGTFIHCSSNPDKNQTVDLVAYSSTCSMLSLSYFAGYGLLAVGLLVVGAGLFFSFRHAKKEEQLEEHVYCTHCKAKVPKDALYCRECGKRQRK